MSPFIILKALGENIPYILTTPLRESPLALQPLSQYMTNLESSMVNKLSSVIAAKFNETRQPDRVCWCKHCTGQYMCHLGILCQGKSTGSYTYNHCRL